MHQNVKETNEELKEKKPEGKKSYMTHKKSPSGSSTSSNLSVQLRRSSGAATDMQVTIALKLPLWTFINDVTQLDGRSSSCVTAKKWGS